jgi:leucyl-tRNA synthetase
VADIQRKVVLLLAPFAPFLAAELWQVLGEQGNILKQPWPTFDAALAKADEVEIGIQVNGKLRGRILVPADSGEEFVREQALAEPKVTAALAGKEVVKAIVVPGKLVNIVVR